MFSYSEYAINSEEKKYERPLVTVLYLWKIVMLCVELLSESSGSDNSVNKCRLADHSECFLCYRYILFDWV